MSHDRNYSLVNTTISYSITRNDDIIVVGNTIAGITITLPNSGLVSSDQYTICDGYGNAGSNNITISGNGLLINGTSTYVISTNYQSVTIFYEPLLNNWTVSNNANYGSGGGGGSPTGSAGGDLSGTYPNPTVVSVAHITTGTLPTANQVSQSLTLTGDTTGSGTTAGTTTTTVAINGTSVPATPSANQIIVATNGTSATWTSTLPGNYTFSGTPTFSNTLALNTTGTSGGLTGSPSITVSGITDSGLGTGIVHSGSGGVFTSSLLVNADIGASSISVGKLIAGTSAQVLLNNATPAATWTTLSGDMTVGNTGATTVASINSATVPAAGSLTTGNVLQVNGASALTYAALNLAGGANYVTGALPVANLAHGTSAQILMSNATPANTWTSMSGDVTISATGATTVAAIDGYTVATPVGGTNGQVLGIAAGNNLTWQTVGGGSVTWASDLSGNSTSTSTNQYVSALSYSSAAGGGNIAINGTGTKFLIAAGNTGFQISQTAAVSGAGANITIAPQAATTSGASGSLIVNCAVPASGTAEGALVYQRAGVNTITMQGLIGNLNYGAVYLGLGATAPTSGNYCFSGTTSYTNINAGTAMYLNINGTSYITFNGDISSVISCRNNVGFISSMTTAKLYQDTTSGASGNPLTIQAQNATGAAHNGGNLVLTSGSSGSATAGNVLLQSAGTTLLTVGGAGLQEASGSVNIAAGGTFTLTAVQYMYPYIILTGSLASNATVVLPATVGGSWTIDATACTLNTHTITAQANSANWATTIGITNIYFVQYGGTGKLYGMSITP